MLPEKSLSRIYDEDVPVPVCFCDVMRAYAVDDGIVLTLYQTVLHPEAETAKASPIARVMLTWAHLRRTIEYLRKFDEVGASKVGDRQDDAGTK